jgi:hypothetical protein
MITVRNLHFSYYGVIELTNGNTTNQYLIEFMSTNKVKTI